MITGWHIRNGVGGGPGFLPRLRGNAFTFTNDVNVVAKKLPRRHDDVDQTGLFVLWADQAKKKDDAFVKSCRFSVNRVRRALQWLKANNHLYHDVVVDDDYLTSVPTDVNLDCHSVPPASVASSPASSPSATDTTTDIGAIVASLPNIVNALAASDGIRCLYVHRVFPLYV
jgi:hypothetical protein